MNLDKAIHILENEERVAHINASSYLEDALQLGIEALIRIRGYRSLKVGGFQILLPGETE